jgi:hypothetical protein
MSNISVVDAIANKQFNAAEEGISEILKSKLTDALSARKDEVAKSVAKKIEEENSDYDEFFKKAMKKFGISSPADLKSDEEKKKFFNYVDKNFKAKQETD